MRITRSKEVAKIQDISIKTFVETFSSQNTEEDMKIYLEEKLSLEQLTTEVENPESFFYLLEDDNEVLGYLKLNIGQSQTEQEIPDGLEIERIYVLSKAQGKRYGQLLYEKAIEEAKSLGISTVWLGVWEKNVNAIGFYQRNGFETFGSHIFTLGKDPQMDLLMKKQL
jgi:ribosomal protein S18 acetylase RimI-like enzyme